MAPDGCEVELGYYRGSLERLLAGLHAMNLQGAVIELDGDSAELERLADTRASSLPQFAVLRQRRRKRIGPFTFGVGSTLLPIENDTLATLRSMLERHADPEIAIELTVRDEQGALVSAPDVGDNDIWVSARLDPAAVAALREALGDELEPY